MTHTYAVLDVSPETYREIRERLKTAAYDHALGEDGVIDMHGIALRENLALGKASVFRGLGDRENLPPAQHIWPKPPGDWPPPPARDEEP